MLYYLHEFYTQFSPLWVFQYVTFRAFAAAATAFLLGLMLGPYVIRLAKRLRIGQQVRGTEAEAIRELHAGKQDTPTMGGVLIIVSVTVSCLLWAIPSNGFVWMTLGTLWFMGAIGFVDDYTKVKQKQSKGLSARQKLLLQFCWVGLLFFIMQQWDVTKELSRQLMVPFIKDPVIHNMGWLGAILLMGLVVAGSSNAVNLTDGIDGLAIGCTNTVAVAYLLMSYVAGHTIFAEYLAVPYVPGSSELAVFCGALLGGGLAFLWYNCHPARIFMGDTGSLALGGAIAAVAIFINQELTLIMVGGVFVMEALSVILQVGYFKMSGGRRIFRCAPIHHHFEILEKERSEREGDQRGAPEITVTIRLWVVSIIFAILGVATLKLR